MTFLLHLPKEARNLIDSPQLSQTTTEFITQVVWECSINAVLIECELKRKTEKEEWNKTFGGRQS
jgi:hypothetical protein